MSGPVSPAPGDASSGPVPIRASDAEREATMGVLRDAAAEGRLTFEELADRLEAAGTAVTRDELAGLAADLPSEGRSAGAPVAWSPGPGTAVAAPDRRRSVFGDLVQEGPWRVPQSGRWSTVFGDVTLDLRQAAVGHARVEIEAETTFGDITLLVPEGVLVEIRARTFFGAVKKEAGHDAPAGAPLVVLSGHTWFGDVRVRAKRLRERLTDLFRGRGGSGTSLPPTPGPGRIDAGGPDPGRPSSHRDGL